MQPFDFKAKTNNRNKGTWEKKSLLFTAALPLGSAPESPMLSVEFVTEAVAQVTTRRGPLRELIVLSPGILTELYSFLL